MTTIRNRKARPNGAIERSGRGRLTANPTLDLLANAIFNDSEQGKQPDEPQKIVLLSQPTVKKRDEWS